MPFGALRFLPESIHGHFLKGDEMPTHRQGSERCECAECGKWFNGLTGFDAHRDGPYDGDRRCLTNRQLEAKGYVERDGVWIRDARRPDFLNQARP